MGPHRGSELPAEGVEVGGEDQRGPGSPEDADGEWRGLADPDELVEYYDPTDVFGDLADALAEAYPSIAPEMEGDDDED
jgi:hypothetical protein